MAVITQTQLENASADANTLEAAINTDADIVSRLGATYPSVPKVIRLAQDELNGQVTLAEMAADEAQVAQVAAESAAGANLSIADSRAAAIAISFPGSVNYIRTAGYSAVGDGGAAFYKRVTSEPLHAGKIQSADGAWWEIVGDTVQAEQFGGTSDGVDCTAALTNAIAYLKAINGGTLQFLAGTYAFSSTLLIDFKGCKIRGLGPFLTTLQLTGNINGISVDGNIDGSQAAYGFELRDLTLKNAASAPTSGRLLFMEAVQEMTVDNVCFQQYWRAIQMDDCQGPLSKNIHNCSFISPAGTTPVAGSCVIYFHGVSGGLGTGLTESVYLSDCRGGGTGTDYCVFLDGCDSIHMTNSHFWGSQTAPLYVVSNSKNVYNIRSTNNSWEALSGHAQFAAVISGNGITMHSIMFTGDQFFNGAQASILIQGTATRAITFANCQVVQAMVVGVRILNGEKIKLDGMTFVDGDISNTGAGSCHVEIGDGSQGPAGVQINGITASQEFFATTPTYGINVINGTTISIRGGLITDVGTQIVSSVGAQELSVEDFDSVFATGPVIASAASIAVPLHCRSARISGSATVNTITGAYRNRKLRLRSDAGCTFAHNAGNIILSGSVNWAAPGGSWLFLEYDPEFAVWIEVGRRVQ